MLNDRRGYLVELKLVRTTVTTLFFELLFKLIYVTTIRMVHKMPTCNKNTQITKTLGEAHTYVSTCVVLDVFVIQ